MRVVILAVAFAGSDGSQAPRNQSEMIANIRNNHFDGLRKGLPLTCEITGDGGSAPVEAAHEFPHSDERSKQVGFSCLFGCAVPHRFVCSVPCQYIDTVNDFRRSWREFRQDRGRDVEKFVSATLTYPVWYHVLLYLVRVLFRVTVQETHFSLGYRFLVALVVLGMNGRIVITFSCWNLPDTKPPSLKN
jgi:hypothetical protein